MAKAAVAAIRDRKRAVLMNSLPNAGLLPQIQGDSAKPNLAASALLAGPIHQGAIEGDLVLVRLYLIGASRFPNNSSSFDTERIGS